MRVHRAIAPGQRRGSLAAAVTLMAAVLVAAPGAPAATLKITPASGPAGTTVKVTGDGYDACSLGKPNDKPEPAFRERWAVRLEWAASKALARTVDMGPSINVPDLLVPEDLAPGRQRLLGSCAGQGSAKAKTTFVVTARPPPITVAPLRPRAQAPRPSLVVDPPEQVQGQTIQLRARDFPDKPCAGGNLAFFLDERRLAAIFTSTDPSDARASATVPRETRPGPQVVDGRCAGHLIAADELEVRAAPRDERSGDPGSGSGSGNSGGTGRVDPPDRDRDTLVSRLPDPVLVTLEVPTPQQIELGLFALGLALLLGGVIVLLIAFPSELFNQTYQNNEKEIHGILGRFGRRRRVFPPVAGFVVFALLDAALCTWLALEEGEDGNPVALAIGTAVALPAVTLWFLLPIEAYTRWKSGVGGTLHVLPSLLLVALVCAVLSSALDLEPAYLYGLAVAFGAASARTLTAEHEGRSVLAGAATLAGLALAAWIAWGALDAEAHGTDRDWPVIVISTILFWMFVMAAEGLVFALAPLRFLDGAKLWRWSFRAWLVTELVAAAFFVYVLMLHGQASEIDAVDQIVKPLGFFVAFGLASCAFWAYFRWETRPTAHLARSRPPTVGLTEPGAAGPAT
jgi:hypothetical protein